MKAIILAAGQGTRLKKYTKNLPKGMLEFVGKTIIQRQIELYKSLNVNDIIIIKGFAGDKIDYKGVKYYINKEYASTNMVESLLRAREEFNDDVIISYSDILFNLEMLEKMIDNKNDFVVAVDDNWKEYWLARYGKVDFDTESLEIDDKGNIISLGKENPNLEDIDSRYIGLLKFSCNAMSKIVEIIDKDYEEYSDKAWKQSGKNIKNAYMTDLIQAVIESGEQVKANRFNNGWIEFDTNEDYERACKWVENGSMNRFIDLLV